MAVLPEKLVHRLNSLYELGDYKFGKILQQCLTEIGANPGIGACLVIPNYASQGAAEVACGKISGSAFLNTTTGAITYCDGAAWIELDWEGKCTQVDANTSNITLNATNIANLLTQLTTLTTNFNTHNHDGVNSPTIDIKALTTTAPVGEYFFSTGSGIDCGPIATSLVVSEGGTSVLATADTLDFTAACFDVTASGNTAIVDIPLLPQLKLDVASALTSIASNTTAISNIATTVSNINTTLTTVVTDLDALEAAYAAHCHDGTDAPAIRIDKIISQDGTSTNIANNFVVCADGLGGWNYIDKATLAGTLVSLVNVGPGETIIAPTSTATQYDIKGFVPGCGIAVNSTITDIQFELDFDNMANVGTAIDPVNDTVILKDASTGDCVQTSVQSLLSGSGGVSVINDLTDVTTTPVDGDTLCYDGATSQWVNVPKAGGGAEDDFVLRTEVTSDVTLAQFQNVPFGGNTLINTGPYIVTPDSFLVPDDNLIYDLRLTLKLNVPELGLYVPISMVWGGTSRNTCQLMYPPFYQMFATWTSNEYSTFPADRGRVTPMTLTYGCKVILSQVQSVQIRIGQFFKAAQNFPATPQILAGTTLEVCSVGPRVI